jgi:hypothetical protein
MVDVISIFSEFCARHNHTVNVHTLRRAPMNPDSKPWLVRTRELQQQTTLLANVEPTDAPFLSCYLDLSRGADHCRDLLNQRIGRMRDTLRRTEQADFDHALSLIESRLAAPFHPDAQGMAVFARGPGGGEFLLSMEFAVPMESRLTLYPTPDIYPLLEMKDNCDRFLLVLVRPGWVQVAEVDLGAVALRGWAASPIESSTANHFGRRGPRGGDPAPLAMARPLRLVERIARASGHDYVFLAGDADLAEQLRTRWSLPSRTRLVDVLPMRPDAGMQDAVEAALAVFVEFEERESRSIAARLVRGVHQRGLAVTGGVATLEALRGGEADILVIAKGFSPDPMWGWDDSDSSRIRERAPDLRAELIRLAGQQGVPVEVVDSDELRYLGGVGCLLRHRTQDQTLRRRQRSGRLQLVA